MATKRDEPVDLDKTSVILTVRMTRIGNRRRVSPHAVEVDADKDAISVSKELVESEEYREIVSFDRSVRDYLYPRALPQYDMLKAGTYRMPVSLVREIDDKLAEFKLRRTELVDAFVEVYPQKVEDAKGRLRSLFNPGDYPSQDFVAREFSFDHRYMTYSVPDALSEVSKAILEREMAQAKLDVQSEVDQIKLALRAAFAELLDKAVQRLQVRDGKPLVFRDTLVTNMEQFIEYFAKRNIVEDSDLGDLVKRAGDVLKGVEKPDDLRRDGALRGRVQTAFGEIREVMETQLMLKPVRRVSFDNEE